LRIAGGYERAFLASSHFGLTPPDALLWAFNTTPRKCLAFQTPLEAFARQLGVAFET
jgi:IS30 family transposase